MEPNSVSQDFPIVCVGGSAGGLDAYTRLLQHLGRIFHEILTWLSLFYETGYLLVAGVFLLAAPDTAFKLLFSNNSYGDVLPRLFGTVLFSIGTIFVQIVRMHIEELYTTTIVVRVPLMVVNLWLFYYSGNPLFLTLFVIVTFGVVLTVTGYVIDERNKIKARTERKHV